MAEKIKPDATSDGNTAPTEGPLTQAKTGFRQNWPAWAKQFPQLRFPETPNLGYQLVDRAELRKKLAHVDPDALKRIEEDMDFLDHELMRLFRERDHGAATQQNRYRMYQIMFMVLATLATLIGSLQALTLTGNPNWVPVFAFIETLVALLTTYLATISGREPSMSLWLSNRRRAENMRREYFRYLMNMPPYDEVDGYERRQLLASRAADINRGIFPDKMRQPPLAN